MFFYVQKFIFSCPWDPPILFEGASDLTRYIVALRFANEMNKEARGYERYIVLDSEIKPAANLIVKINNNEIDFFVKYE